MRISKAEIHIYMPKEKMTDELLESWNSKLSEVTSLNNIKFEIKALEDFVN